MAFIPVTEIASFSLSLLTGYSVHHDGSTTIYLSQMEELLELSGKQARREANSPWAPTVFRTESNETSFSSREEGTMTERHGTRI